MRCPVEGVRDAVAISQHLAEVRLFSGALCCVGATDRREIDGRIACRVDLALRSCERPVVERVVVSVIEGDLARDVPVVTLPCFRDREHVDVDLRHVASLCAHVLVRKRAEITMFGRSCCQCPRGGHRRARERHRREERDHQQYYRCIFHANHSIVHFVYFFPPK